LKCKTVDGVLKELTMYAIALITDLIVKGTAVIDGELSSLQTTLPQLRIAEPPRFAQHR
jgi:hypothetical protein